MSMVSRPCARACTPQKFAKSCLTFCRMGRAPGRAMLNRPPPHPTAHLCPRRNLMSLAQAQCEACRADAPKVSDDELAGTDPPRSPDWNIEVRDDHMELERVYAFKNFRHAWPFSTPSAPLPKKSATTRRCSPNGASHVTWWSHEMRGLRCNDFIMAARTDVLAASAEGPAVSISSTLPECRGPHSRPDGRLSRRPQPRQARPGCRGL